MANDLLLYFWIGIIMNRKLTKLEIWMENNPLLFVMQVFFFIILLFVLGLAFYLIVEKGFQADDEMEEIRMTQFMEEIK